jgi:hypothetical protein
MIIDPERRAAGEPVVTLTMSMSQAESVSESISDLLCWRNGFMAAKGEDFRFEPMGIESIRELRIALKSAMRKSA